MKFKGYSDEVLKAQLGGRYTVSYRIAADEKTALEMAKAMCVEQTVEFPAAHIECDAIHSDILGQIESFGPAGECPAAAPSMAPESYRAVISYSDQTATEEFAQFFNNVFGNSSLLPGITVERINMSEQQLKWFKGPKYGVKGLREKLGVSGRPIAFTALKPMGLPTEALADEAYQCALGGVDMIKDDHGLMNQTFSEYKNRVKQVCDAVRAGNAESGHNMVYVPNLSGSFDTIMDRVKFAEECGAGGVMLAPGLVGYDTMQYVAQHTDLPIVAHPAMAGCLLDKGAGGFDCGCILGQLPRICGADVSVFPNYGGRFSLSQAQCRSIVDMCNEEIGDMPSIFPAPAGGMTFEKVAPMKEFYGNDTAFLMGGGLFTVTPDLPANCRKFIEMLEA